MTKNKHVILKSFLGTKMPAKETEERENYWKLIGERGRVIDNQEINDRVLVQFESKLDDYKLENHNSVKNSLWIRKSDLIFEKKFVIN